VWWLVSVAHGVRCKVVLVSPLFRCVLMSAALDGAVEEPRCATVRSPSNRYNVKLGAIWCEFYKRSQVVFI
jgi:hypothetical protein